MEYARLPGAVVKHACQRSKLGFPGVQTWLNAVWAIVPIYGYGSGEATSDNNAGYLEL